MSIDRNNLNKIIYTHTKQGQLHTVIQGRVFEEENHGVKEWSDVDFINIDPKDFLKRANKYNDFFRVQREGMGAGSKDIYPTITSSQLYFLLLNFVKIPTNLKDHTEKTFLHVCNIRFKKPDDMSSANLHAFNFLSFIGLIDERDLILEDAVYNYLIEHHSDALDIEEKSSIEIRYKIAILDRIENTDDIVCLTHQQNFKNRCKEVLAYKALNEVTAHDNGRMDNLQFHLIEQQLRFGMYLSLKPILVLTYLKFNRLKAFIDQTGNLFFSITLPTKSPNKTDVLDFNDVLMQVMDYGFYLSYPNMEEKVTFSKESADQPPKQFNDASFAEREGLGESIGRNELYTLLFRLLDSKMSSVLERVDDLILNKQYEEFHFEVINSLE